MCFWWWTGRTLAFKQPVNWVSQALYGNEDLVIVQTNINILLMKSDDLSVVQLLNPFHPSLSVPTDMESQTCTVFSFPPRCCRCTASDADAGGQEDLSVPADGGHTLGHSLLPDTTVQTLIRTHQKWQVSTPLNVFQHELRRANKLCFYFTPVHLEKFLSVFILWWTKTGRITHLWYMWFAFE